MGVFSKVQKAYDQACSTFSSFILNHPREYMATTGVLGAVCLVILFASDLAAQSSLETEVTQALDPLGRLLVGPIAKGLAVIGMFSFVGFLLAGRYIIAVSSLVGAVILGLVANIVTSIFSASSSSSFTLGN